MRGEPTAGGESGAETGLGAKLAALFSRGAQAWRAPRAERELELLETLAMGGRRQLMLVRCGGERFLVGAGPDGITAVVRTASVCAGAQDAEKDVPRSAW